MFGRDAVLPLNSLLSPQLHYLGNDLNVLSLEALKNIYQIATENLHQSHAGHDSILPKQLPHHFTENDTVLIKNHTATLLTLATLGTIVLYPLKAIRSN